MQNILKRLLLIVIVALVCASCSRHACARELENQENNSLVGRIAHIEGQLLRYVPDDDDWVLTEMDTPFGEYDNVFSSEDGKVEIIMPNNTLVRIGGDTQVQLIELTHEVTEIDVSSGTARLYNRSPSAEIKATTPFGDVIMPPGTVCDIFVHESQAEVASLKGSVQFVKPGSNTSQEVIAGSSSMIATPDQIIASNHSAPPAWDGWNVDRDVQWTQRMQARGDSKQYLPESLQDHAYELEENGSWERVYYDGADRYFWRPAYVAAGWTPFSSGRWIVWHGEQTWVPYDSFGYVTHHYGNWVYARNCWYWAPPVSYVMVSTGAPLLNIGMSWYPGRVAWLSSSMSIGWFPLAPYEVYYSSRYWGPRSRVGYYNNYYKCNKYRYKHYRHARFIDNHRFYGKKNYRHAGLRKGHRGEKFRGSARIPEKMRGKYKAKNKNQYASNMSGFRDKVKKSDVRRDKRNRTKTHGTLTANPFKRKIAKAGENKRRAGKTVFKNSTRKVGKKNIKVQKRPTLAKTKQVNRLSKAGTKNQQGRLNKSKRTYSQPSKKVVQARKKVQTSRKVTTGKARKRVARIQQNKTKTFVAKNTLSGARGQSKRSSKTYLSKRSNNTGKKGSSFSRPANRQQSRQNSANRSHGYAAQGRRR